MYRGLGIGLGSLAGGFIFQEFGAQSLFFWNGLVAVALLGVFWFSQQRFLRRCCPTPKVMDKEALEQPQDHHQNKAAPHDVLTQEQVGEEGESTEMTEMLRQGVEEEGEEECMEMLGEGVLRSDDLPCLQSGVVVPDHHPNPS